MKKIIFYSYSLDGGGAEKVCQMLANRFALENGFLVYLILIDRRGVFLKSLNSDIKIISHVKFFIRFKIFNFLSLIYDIWCIKPDYLISFAEWPNFYSGLTKFIARKKIRLIYTEHNTKTFINDYKTYGVSKFINKLSIFSYSKADNIICCSKKVKEEVTKVLPNQLTSVIYNPVDCKQALELSKYPVNVEFNQDKVNLVAIGRFHPQKDYKTMLQAFEKAYLTNENLALYILGDGIQQAEIEELIKGLNSRNSINLLGFQDNPFSYLVKADALIHSALFEGFGNIFIEALSVGTPILTTDCDTPIEIINHKLQGTIVPVSNVDALAQAILNQPKKNEEIVQSCLERSKMFDIEKCFQQYKFELMK